MVKLSPLTEHLSCVGCHTVQYACLHIVRVLERPEFSLHVQYCAFQCLARTWGVIEKDTSEIRVLLRHTKHSWIIRVAKLYLRLTLCLWSSQRIGPFAKQQCGESVEKERKTKSLCALTADTHKSWFYFLCRTARQEEPVPLTLTLALPNIGIMSHTQAAKSVLQLLSRDPV